MTNDKLLLGMLGLLLQLAGCISSVNAPPVVSLWSTATPFAAPSFLPPTAVSDPTLSPIPVIPTSQPTIVPKRQLPVGPNITFAVPIEKAEVVYDHQMRGADDIAVGTDGDLYVADWRGYSIWRLTKDNKLVLFIRTPVGAVGVTGPMGVGFDAKGVLHFVTPDEIFRVSQVDSELQMVRILRLPGTNQMTFGPDGNLYVTNQRTNSVMRVRSDGSAEVVVGGLARPVDVAFSPSGEMFVAEFGRGVLRVNPNGTTSPFAQANFGSVDPIFIAFDKQGNLYGHGNGTLFKFDSNGRQIPFQIDGNNPRVMLNGNPGGIAFDESGDLYIGDGPSGKIARLDPNGHLEIVFRGFNPSQIAVGSDESIYAIDGRNFPQYPGQVLRLNSKGEVKVIAEFNEDPQTIALDASGNLYVCLSNLDFDRRIVRISQDGKVSDLLSQNRECGSMAVSPSGELYVAVIAEGRIYRVLKDGSSEVFAGALPKAIVWQFALAFSPDGILYAADGSSGNMLRFSQDGTFSVLGDIPGLKGAPNILAVAPNGSIYVKGDITRLYKMLPNGSKVLVASEIWGDFYGLAFDPKGCLYLSRGGEIDRICGIL